MSARCLTACALLAASPFTLAEPIAHPAVPGTSSDRTLHASVDPATAGAVLLGELNCTSCHDPGKHAPWIKRKQAPSLVVAGTRIRPAFLERFIANPAATKPGTTMPAVLRHLPEGERAKAATALTHYLVRNAPPAKQSPPINDESVESGRKLFHSVGCVACHSPEGQSFADSMPLGPVANKYHFGDLVEFLKNPRSIRPSGRMPNLHLDHYEAVDIASFLLRGQEKEPAFALDNTLADRGAELFKTQGCVNCHRAGTDVVPTAPPLSAANRTKGCLSKDDGPWPRYAFNDRQREALETVLSTVRPAPTPEEQIKLTLTRHNCITCHQRDDYGGIPDHRRPFFTTDNVNLGEQASVPPALTGVGAKLTPEHLRKVLVQGHKASVRPYMTTHMPAFGEDNVAHLVKLFGDVDSLPALDFDRVKDEKIARTTGVELVGAKGFGCVACHTWDGKNASTLRGLDLTHMANRLQENWFHHYLRDPQRFHPQTIMPSYWPGGKSVRPEILDGNSGSQIDAIWQYLSRGRQGRQPNGLVREALPVVVGKEAVMLRRSYPGIGKRGIGVGYPSRINLSFDAGQMRLGSIWQGDFIEASGVWRSQGSGNVREQSRDVIRFPVGPALALLADETTPWPEDDSKKAKGFQFQGYTLDKLRRPTFRYSFAGANIEDRFLDLKDDQGRPFFRRALTVTYTGPEKQIYIRLAAHKKLTSPEEANYYLVGDNLRITLRSNNFTRPCKDGRELIAPIPLDQKFLTFDYHWTKTP